jgi:O-antigen/teichoic acid export membrane protein/peptidoglycan/xylan/chitin deacetylase (PgdA/CDA1 family)
VNSLSLPRVSVAYHAVSDTWNDSLATSVADLRRQLWSLHDRGLTGVTVGSPARDDGIASACVTFDDGLVSVADRAAPLLAELRWPATVFVVTEVLDSGLELTWLASDDPAAESELRCLDWDQLRQLAAAGWEVGSHSSTHTLLSELDDSEVAWELEHSRQRILDEIGRCSTISYPFGELDRRVMKAARRAGYERGTGLAGPFRLREEMALPRVAISRKDGPARFALKTSRPFWIARATPAWTLVERLRGSPSPAALSARVTREPARAAEPRISVFAAVAEDPGQAGDEKLSVASGSLLFFASQIGGNLGYFFAVLVLARTLNPAERGVVAFMTVSALMLGRLSGVGINEAATVFAARTPELRPQLLSTVLATTALTAAATGAIGMGALALAGGITPPGIHDAELIVLGVGVVAAALVNAGAAFLLGLARFRRQAVVMALGPWTYTVVLIGLVLTSHVTPLGAIIAWTVSHLVFATALFVASSLGVGLRRIDLRLLRESISFGYRAWVGNLCRFLNFRTDQLLLGFLGTEAALGLYAVAVNASEMLLYLPSAVGAALIPAVARMAHSDRTTRTLRVFRLTMLATTAGVAAAAVTAPLLLPLVFGSRYEHAVTPFLLLLPGAFGFVAISVCSSALVAAGAPGGSSLGPVASLVSGLALDFALIPFFGADGAAVAATAAFLGGGAASIWALRKELPFQLLELVPSRGDAAFAVQAARRLMTRFRRGGLTSSEAG